MSRSSLVPQYCLHKPSGRAYVRLSGKVVYCGRYGTAASKREYGRLISEYAASAGCVVQAGTSQLTVVELIAAYIGYAEGYYRKNGKPTRSLDNVKLGLRLLKDLYGSEPVATFSPLNLLAIQNNLVDKGASRKHVNEQTGIIKRVFRWGVSRELVPPNVHVALSAVEGLRKGRTKAGESKPVLPVDDSVVDATLPHMPPISGRYGSFSAVDRRTARGSLPASPMRRGPIQIP